MEGYMYGSFYGWYLKCQTNEQTLAIIPAIHRAGRESTCSIQFITKDKTWTVSFDGKAFHRKGKRMTIGRNYFGEGGIKLAIHTDKLQVDGTLRFGTLHPLRYDIMGPFALLPFMECRHHVYSMRHTVQGKLRINGQVYDFHNGGGYWEGDSGSSFPKRYIWTQYVCKQGSVMLAVADIPVWKSHFTGIIGIVMWKGKEYRFATYLGAKVKQIRGKTVQIEQGKMELEAKLLEERNHPLQAPVQGKMERTIHESVACRARYRFYMGEKLVFEWETEQASFEHEYFSW
jgi:hypothetical protein